MNGAFRQSMAWLHTWTGLLFGWVLLAMFMTGTASYFRPEITRWMQPETGRPASVATAAVGAEAYLRKTAPNARSWSISLPDARQATTQVSWRPQPKPGEAEKPRRRGRRGDQALLDAGSGQVVKPRETRGGEFFYRFHFQMHYMPVILGRWMAGLCAMFMLVAIVSGVITHKRIFKDMFTYRPKKAAQRAWLDAHNLTAVLALPFHAMITYTGLVTLMGLYMPWGMMANYKTTQAYYEAVLPRAESLARQGPAPLVPLQPVLAKASEVWGGGRPWIVSVTNPGDKTARIEVTRHSGDQLSNFGGQLTFDGVTGRLITARPAPGPAETTGAVMYGLHMGRYAEPVLRWAYFVCGLAGCAMVATGLILWNVARRQKLPDPAKPHFGFRLVERLNIGAISGIPAGMAAVLWANRLLPVGLAERSAWEVHGFFIAWGVTLAWATLRPAAKAWVETLSAAAFLVAFLPVLSAITSPRNLVRSLVERDWAMAAFDLTLVVLGGLLAFCALKAKRYKPAVKARRKAVERAEAAA